MDIKINNVTWNFQPLNHYDEEMLGFAYVGIPGNMMKRFVNECRWKEDLKVPPHYYEEDLESCGSFTNGSSHECYNADTQIVLMNWLYDKRRNYNLEYRGKDPYWLFHDHEHSQNDVHSYEVNGVTGYIEQIRLLEGAEMAKHYGHFILPETAAEVALTFNKRFSREHVNFNPYEFLPYLEDNEAKELFEFHLETMTINY